MYKGGKIMNNSMQPKDYQDELDTDPNKTDRATEELTDNLADDAGIPQNELAHELKKETLSETGQGDEDMREYIEDRDEDMNEGDSGTSNNHTPGEA
jgi:hypothetical protein